MSSCVRPGVLEIRARFLRPVRALIRLDLPTLDRPAKAISMPRIGGSDAGVPAAATKCHSPANRRRPASISARVKVLDVIGSRVSLASCPAQGLCPDRRGRTRVPGVTQKSDDVRRRYDAFFFSNIALMLSNNSILAPCLRMMTLCCSTESELFHAQ